jgi:hypothetical protein
MDQEKQRKEKTFGWVKSDRAISWDTREALESTPERKNPAHIYDNLLNLINNNEEGILFRDEMTEKKWPIEKFRYPILSIFKRGCFGQNYAIACVAFFAHDLPPLCRGYVAIEDNRHHAVMRKVLLFNRSDVAELLVVLDALLAPEGRDIAEIKKVWMSSIIKTVGADKDTKINKCIKKRLGILFPDKHNILSKKINEIEQSNFQAVSAMLEDCDKIRDKLIFIRNTPECWFKNFGSQFTWLPQKLMELL